MIGPLRFECVSKTFGASQVLDNLTLDIPLTGVTFLVGRSGSGKSVLCRLAVGLLKPDAGSVTLDGQRVDQLSERALTTLRAQVPYLVQGPALLDWLTLLDNVCLATANRRDRAAAQEALARVGLEDLGERFPPEVSPSVRKRAAIARALVLRPAALLLDEPTTGLDREAAEKVTATLDQLRKDGLAALVVSHDYRALEVLADRVVELASGRVASLGPPQAFLASRHASVAGPPPKEY